ncbi:hypothetical protein GOQ27_15030 [Clostridium sp. D2Q-11]|uniref:Uncharacterized protein n=1 Tax=Anaeromonas frigoriresistens TaxID=2683708 RepID=A0A942UZC0_9FIRM|nr:hypothetical protein [Anaeromonas frigoriresistens]MBS4539786.1 hypothetical protein [Anaeromonas frigoriresistens]
MIEIKFNASIFERDFPDKLNEYLKYNQEKFKANVSYDLRIEYSYAKFDKSKTILTEPLDQENTEIKHNQIQKVLNSQFNKIGEILDEYKISIFDYISMGNTFMKKKQVLISFKEVSSDDKKRNLRVFSNIPDISPTMDVLADIARDKFKEFIDKIGSWDDVARMFGTYPDKDQKKLYKIYLEKLYFPSGEEYKKNTKELISNYKKTFE